jgi:spore coat protein CotH
MKPFNWFSDHVIPFSLKDPDDYSDWTKIQDYLNEVEDVLYGNNFEDDTEGWRKYLDEDSFIDWYLVNEVAKNNDACWHSSVYMYFNPKDGKIHMGPLWDFDIGFGNIDYNGCDQYEGFWIKNSGWYSRLFQDSGFVTAVKNRWSETKSDLEALGSTESSSVVTSVSEMADNLKTDAEVNFNVWTILGTYVWPNAAGYEERTTYQSEVDYLTLWLKNRIAWLDDAIGSL